MTNPTIFDGNEHRPMTNQEHQEWVALCDDVAKRKQAAVAKEAARVAALAKLGLTADEIAALFG